MISEVPTMLHVATLVGALAHAGTAVSPAHFIMIVTVTLVAIAATARMRR